MDAAAFASQLREALDYLAQGISADPQDIDDITGARVTSYADAGYLTGDAGFEITAPDGSQLQVTVLAARSASPAWPGPAAASSGSHPAANGRNPMDHAQAAVPGDPAAAEAHRPHRHPRPDQT
jgi:hypothetical protein